MYTYTGGGRMATLYVLECTLIPIEILHECDSYAFAATAT